MEGILGLFDSRGAPSRMLRWHYRSRHESLIKASNQELYENGLVVFASPDSDRQNLGLRYHHLLDCDEIRSTEQRWRSQKAQCLDNKGQTSVLCLREFQG